MDKAKPKTVVVIVGMPGAGKSLASSVAEERGVPGFVSGDIIRAEVRRRNLLPSRKNRGRLVLKIREEVGMGAVAIRLALVIAKMDTRLLVDVGPRNMEELA